MEALKFTSVGFSFDGEKKNKVLKSVSFTIEEGQFVCLIGHNGSGKSTLARLINGLLTLQEGTIEVFGVPLDEKHNLMEIRRKIGMVFQNPDNQMVASIVENDLAFGAENIGMPREEIARNIDYALEAVDMAQYKHKTPNRLSGGQKQRIAIAGALVVKPKLLVLDEATAMLDPKGRAEIMRIVHKLNKENGMTVISITHFMDEAVNADRVLVLNDGELVLDGTPTEVFSHKQLLEKSGLALPPSTLLAEKLRSRGVPIEGEILTKEELKDKLCALFQKS